MIYRIVLLNTPGVELISLVSILRDLNSYIFSLFYLFGQIIIFGLTINKKAIHFSHIFYLQINGTDNDIKYTILLLFNYICHYIYKELLDLKIQQRTIRYKKHQNKNSTLRKKQRVKMKGNKIHIQSTKQIAEQKE